MHDEKNGQPQTENASEKSRALATQDGPTSKQVELVENYNLVGSESMKLIDDSATHIFSSMKAITANQPDASVRMLEPDRVQSICMCADQITKLIRLKLDIKKASRSE